MNFMKMNSGMSGLLHVAGVEDLIVYRLTGLDVLLSLAVDTLERSVSFDVIVNRDSVFLHL